MNPARAAPTGLDTNMVMRNQYTRRTRSTRTRLAVVAAALLTALAATAWGQPGEAKPLSPPTTRPSTGPLLFVGAAINAPYSFHDGEGDPTGYDVDVMEAIAERLGRSVSVKLMTAEQMTAAIADGEADGVIGMGVARGREDPRERWSLCGPTTTRDYRIAVVAGSDGLTDDATHHSLSGLRVAVGRNDPVTELFAANHSVTLELTNTPTEACQRVYTRRVRAFVADQNTIQYGARLRKDSAIRMIGAKFYRVESYGPAVPVDGEPGLAASIAGAIAALEADGVLAGLRTKWFAHQVNPTSYARQIAIGASAIAGAALLACLVVIGRLVLRNSVAKRTRKLHAELEVLRKQVSDLKRDGRPAEMETADAEEAPIAETAPFEAAPTALNSLIESCVERIQKSVGRRIQVSLDLAADLPPALVDPLRVERMLLRLCANARDAIDKQRETHPETPQRIWIATRMADPAEKPANIDDTHDAFVAIAVRDNGCGIRKEMVQRIFHRGYTTKPNAAGRGLTYVYETIAEHGGWIDVESAAGRGAMFSVFLPVANG
jgi:signal transduction histidine kinase